MNHFQSFIKCRVCFRVVFLTVFIEVKVVSFNQVLPLIGSQLQTNCFYRDLIGQLVDVICLLSCQVLLNTAWIVTVKCNLILTIFKWMLWWY